MASNWGIGLGSFTGGIDRGIGTGLKLRDIYDKSVMRGAVKEAQGQAEQERDTAAQNLVQVAEQAGPLPEATAPTKEGEKGGLGGFISGMFGGGDDETQQQKQPQQMPKVYSYGGEDYASMEEAAGKAKEKLAPVNTYMDKYTQDIQDKILSKTGNAELAEQYGDFASQAKSKRMFASAADAYQKFGAGNYEGGIQQLGDIMENGNFGVQVVGHQPVNDESGNLTGFNIRMRNTDTGKEYDQTMTPDSLLEFTKTFATPVQMFSQLYQRQGAADAAKVELAKAGAKNSFDEYKLEKQHGNKLEEITTKEKIKQQYGGGDGLTGFKRPTAPVEALRQATSEIIKQSAGFDGKPTLSESDALNRAADRVAKIYGMTKEELLQSIKANR